ncbi:EcsC family protein [Acinetobacter puyangensis]|uniref:EcsC protein family protein n=1 Tax=Acinetobacter puyangensis TaxID=1096779 RepID=A0A240EDS7_9GAMM|nr:EcsC family protein [Acinetobacter puyangensis]SNX46711.1 EcsC protein family protein [Acinetobacter puyangensis]
MSNKSGIFQKVREQAQKISHLGGKSLQKVAQEPVEKTQSEATSGQVVEGQAYQRDITDSDYQDIRQLFRHQFPTVTRQVFGRRYNTLNKVSRFVLPNGMDQAADEVLELLSEFASRLAATESVLAETGCKEITELQKDPARSQRAGNALTQVNKVIAAVQGGVSGLTGLAGAAADLPISVILSLKTMYEIGHVYGFELDNEEDRRAVYTALSQSDLSLIAEKQTIFLGLRTLKSVFDTGDYGQLQSFLNSNYSIEQFQGFLTDEQGNYKWSGFGALGKIKLLKFTTPVLGAAIGAIYNVRLIEEVAKHADEIFSLARQYLHAHQDEDISVLDAYQKEKSHRLQVSQLANNDITALLEQPNQPSVAQEDILQKQAIEDLSNSDTISQVELVDKKAEQKTDQVEATTEQVEDQAIETGIEQLAAQNVVPVAKSEQKPAITDESLAKEKIVEPKGNRAVKKTGKLSASRNTATKTSNKDNSTKDVSKDQDSAVAPVKDEDNSTE